MTEQPLRPYMRSMNAESTVWYAGDLLTFLAESNDTGGQFTLLEGISRRGAGPPLHTHSREDEAFYVIDGQVKVRAGDREFQAESGSFVFLPRGVPHAFVTISEKAKILGFCTPGGIEGAFHALSEPAEGLALPPPPNGPPDIERMISVFGTYGSVPAGPPLQP